MDLFSFRMKDGNCVIIYAKDELSATTILKKTGVQTTPVGVRVLTRFVANFALTDSGDLHTTLLDSNTLHELAPDYPVLQAARAHSYTDFASSRSENPSEPVLFNDSVRQGEHDWNRRDRDVIAYAVQQDGSDSPIESTSSQAFG